MFTEYLLESAGKPEHRREVTAILVAAMQFVVLLFATALPLLFGERLYLRSLQALIAAHLPSRGDLNGERSASGPNPAGQRSQQMQQPAVIPKGVDLSPASSQVGGKGKGASQKRLGSPMAKQMPQASLSEAMVLTPAPTVVPLTVSEVQLGAAIHKVPPRYPEIARSARIQGEVLIRALISAEGDVLSVEVQSGHPLLRSEAIEAVRQWKYRPYLLNGEPIVVESMITVRFTLY